MVILLAGSVPQRGHLTRNVVLRWCAWTILAPALDLKSMFKARTVLSIQPKYVRYQSTTLKKTWYVEEMWKYQRNQNHGKVKDNKKLIGKFSTFKWLFSQLRWWVSGTLFDRVSKEYSSIPLDGNENGDNLERKKANSDEIWIRVQCGDLIFGCGGGPYSRAYD